MNPLDNNVLGPSVLPPIVDEVSKWDKIKKIMGILGAVMIVLSGVFYFLFTSNLKTDFDSVKADVTSRETKISDIKARIESYKSAEKKMDVETEVKKNEILNSIPVGMRQDGIIEDLYDIAKTNEIELRSVSFGTSRGVYDNVSALTISASFEGNYSDLINFLKSIEENKRFLKVSSVNVQVADVVGEDMKRVTFSLSMSAFYQD